jgi:predicted metal-dependent hydrolase
MNARRPTRTQPDPRQMSLLWEGAAEAPADPIAPQHPAPRKMSEPFRSEPPAVHVPAPPVQPERVQPPAAGVAFRHPQASREIRLGEVLIAYEFKRARRRSIGMVVGTDGLSVRAPRWSSVADVEAALREKTRWICTKLAEQRERSRRLEAARIEWRDGTALPFLGETVIVVLDTRVTGTQLQAEAQALPGVPRLTLHVGLHHTAAPEQIRDTVQAWLQRQARRVFLERCETFAQRLGVRMTKLVLSSAQTRWGSASADGVIRLNWRLVHFGLPTIDYVVAHELAHLREMNHSPAFWDVVRSVIPDLDAARERLKHEILPDLGA